MMNSVMKNELLTVSNKLPKNFQSRPKNLGILFKKSQNRNTSFVSFSLLLKILALCLIWTSLWATVNTVVKKFNWNVHPKLLCRLQNCNTRMSTQRGEPHDFPLNHLMQIDSFALKLWCSSYTEHFKMMIYAQRICIGILWMSCHYRAHTVSPAAAIVGVWSPYRWALWISFHVALLYINSGAALESGGGRWRCRSRRCVERIESGLLAGRIAFLLVDGRERPWNPATMLALSPVLSRDGEP